MDKLKEKVANEAERIEEDVDHSARSHFVAANRWAKYHLCIGLPSAIIAALSGGAYIGEQTVLAVLLSALSTALITTLTFLKPSERSEIHNNSGNQYLELRNKTRIFREIELGDDLDNKTAVKKIKELAEIKDNLNQRTPAIKRKDYEKGKKNIDEGRSTHRIDRENTNDS